MRLLPLATKSLQNSANHHIVDVDWKRVVEIVKKASGVPEAILTKYKN